MKIIKHLAECCKHIVSRCETAVRPILCHCKHHVVVFVLSFLLGLAVSFYEARADSFINTSALHVASSEVASGVQAKFDTLSIRPMFYSDEEYNVYGSWFKLSPNIWASAGHVYQGANYTLPDFIGPEYKTVVFKPGGFDIVFVIKSLAELQSFAAQQLSVGFNIALAGYPAAASRAYEIREAKVLIRRDAQQWVLVHNDLELPVAGGMSGGPVIMQTSPGNWTVVGVLVMMDGEFDADFNPATLPRQASDCVSIYDAISAINKEDASHVSIVSNSSIIEEESDW